MGGPDDAQAVVDTDCRVRGVEGLRVIDASVMPADCRANTHLTTVMIAEKIASGVAGAVKSA
jgi:choline dehydrogenase